MPAKNIFSQKQLTDEQIKKTHERKEFELFDVRPNLSSHRESQDVATRLANWVDHLKNLGITKDDYWIGGDPDNADVLYLCFANGLRIEDYDTKGVSFWAHESKDKLNEQQDSVANIVRIAANHLYRRGDFVLEGRNNDLNGSNYSGSAPYVEAFKKAYVEARKTSSAEIIRNISSERR